MTCVFACLLYSFFHHNDEIIIEPSNESRVETPSESVKVEYPQISVKQKEKYMVIEYVFDKIYRIKVISNGVIVRSESGIYFIAENGEVRKYNLDYGDVKGVIDRYLVAKKNSKVVVMDEGNVVWSKSLEPGSSVAVGKSFIVIVEPYYDTYNELNVNVTFYFPKSDKKLKYSFKTGGQMLVEPKFVVAGEYTIIGVPYPWYEWVLIYFKNGTLLWRKSIGRKCAGGASISDAYVEFNLSIKGDGYGYTISKDGHAINYFNASEFKGMCLSPNNAVGIEVLNACIALKMEGEGVYFYKWEDNDANRFTFKANFTKSTLSSDGHLLAIYDDHASVFNCSGEVFRIGGFYKRAYSLDHGFVLINGTHIYLPFRNLSIKVGDLKIVGTFRDSIVGVKDDKVVIIKMLK
ncbi:hypothetical protein PNA2_1723 [Pyrococcus sp. NA2]|nr:hypothetical protein PNA2_1723 [Pyrococcus sp. NA2]